MASIVDQLTWDWEERGWENVRAYLDSATVGYVCHRRAPNDGWWANACNVCLGTFSTRDEGKRAIIQWFCGLDIADWPAPSE